MDIRRDKADQQKNSLHALILIAVRWALSRKFLGEPLWLITFNVKRKLRFVFDSIFLIANDTELKSAFLNHQIVLHRYAASDELHKDTDGPLIPRNQDHLTPDTNLYFFVAESHRISPGL